MFNVFFKQRIWVRDLSRIGNKYWMYDVGKASVLPFTPASGMLFLDGDIEIESEEVYWNILEARFDVVCGGMLCDDEDDAKRSLDDELSRGWNLIRTRETP